MTRTLVVLAVAVVACHGNRAGELAQACLPASASDLTAASAALLGGTHDITFVATSGSRSGQAVKARLMLRDQTDSLRRGTWSPAEQRFIGTLDVTPEDLGAVRMGESSANDPMQPGVGVYVAPASGGVSITARIGTLSNMRGEPAIDAGYFALHVREVADGLIRGHWASGDGRNEVAAGHFCARRR